MLFLLSIFISSNISLDSIPTIKGQYYKYEDCDLVFIRDSMSDNSLSSYSVNNRVSSFKNLSVEIFSGVYFISEDTIHTGSRITTRSNIWKIGGNISIEPIPRVILSLAISYGSTETLSGLSLDLFGPPKFSISQFAFQCSYKVHPQKFIYFYLGSGISFYNAELYLDGNTMNSIYLCPLITTGLELDKGSPWFLGVQFEYVPFYFKKYGSQEISLENIFPSLTINFGYKFNLNY